MESKKGKYFFLNQRLALAHDLVMVPIAWLGAYWLRFNLDVSPEIFSDALQTLPIVWITQGLAFWYFGLYRGIWRFASIPDFIRIAKAVFAGLALAAFSIFIVYRLEGVPRSVFILYPVLLGIFLGVPRLLYRWLKDRALYLDTGLVVGAGRAGEMLVRDMQQATNSEYLPVAFVDDDKQKIGRELRGVPVIGGCEKISIIADSLNIDFILIALPAVNSGQMRRIVEICEKSGKPFRSLPRLQDLASGKVSLRELRDVTIEDLLGRDEVNLDWSAITNSIRNKAILVTGGGGSIGSELSRQIAGLGPSQLIVLDHSEFNLFEIDRELRQSFPSLSMDCILGDVKDSALVSKIFKQYQPEIVFHAAAYKHVPLLEKQARAAVRNNVLGTKILADNALAFECKEFVFISTDKAVNPTNLMGTTKRVAEIYCQALDKKGETRFITVRFGNVLGSAGSVIPTFREQIAQGGPVTVTHPEIERFFMTIPEASRLILQAGTMGEGGEIYVLDMGEPVKITYLAEKMITLSGKQPGEDIEIVYTGLRPGEKMYEELFHEKENMAGTQHPKIMKAVSRAEDAKRVETIFSSLKNACDSNNETEIVRLLLELVPESNMAKQSQPDNTKVVPIQSKK